MVPPLDQFQGKNKNCSSFARTISVSRRSFFANLTTFEWRFGLRIFENKANQSNLTWAGTGTELGNRNLESARLIREFTASTIAEEKRFINIILENNYNTNRASFKVYPSGDIKTYPPCNNNDTWISHSSFSKKVPEYPPLASILSQ